MGNVKRFLTSQQYFETWVPRVSGTQTPAMTHYYLKVQPWHFRKKIIEAFVMAKSTPGRKCGVW